MEKSRKYLKDLISVNINKLVLETGYFELQIGDIHLSLAPERHPNGRLLRHAVPQPYSPAYVMGAVRKL